MSRYLAAAIQMDTQDDREENFRTLEKLIAQAAEQGAKLICMPECVTYLGRNIADAAEEVPGGPSFRFFPPRPNGTGCGSTAAVFMKRAGTSGPTTAPCS